MRFIWLAAAAFILLGAINLAAGKPSWEYLPGPAQRGVDVQGPTNPG